MDEGNVVGRGKMSGIRRWRGASAVLAIMVLLGFAGAAVATESAVYSALGSHPAYPAAACPIGGILAGDLLYHCHCPPGYICIFGHCYRAL